jgi:hypothetical protein
MDEPVVYLSTWRIKDGQFEAYRQFYARLLDTIREPDKDLIAFYAFGNDDGTEITNVHVFPDVPTLERHMDVIADTMGLLPETLTSAIDFMEPLGVQVYGTPGRRATAMDQGMKDGGVPFTGKERFLGGFSLADLRGAG